MLKHSRREAGNGTGACDHRHARFLGGAIERRNTRNKVASIRKVDVMSATAYTAFSNAVVAILERPARIDDYGRLQCFKLSVQIAPRVKARCRRQISRQRANKRFSLFLVSPSNDNWDTRFNERTCDALAKISIPAKD